MNEVIIVTPELINNFGLERFEPVFYTGRYGCNVYYQLKNELYIYEYANLFYKSEEWINKQNDNPTLFFHKKL